MKKVKEDKYYITSLTCETKKAKLTEAKNRMVFTKGLEGGVENGENVGQRYKLQAIR